MWNCQVKVYMHLYVSERKKVRSLSHVQLFVTHGL